MISLSIKYNPAMFLATASFGEKISVNIAIDLKFKLSTLILLWKDFVSLYSQGGSNSTPKNYWIRNDLCHPKYCNITQNPATV